MSEKISRDDWSQWASSPVTKSVMSLLNEAQQDAINAMLNVPVVKETNIESYALRMMSLRFFIDGLGQATDLESIKAAVVEPEPASGGFSYGS